MKNILFLCTGNTARSILAEAILRQESAGRYGAFSAGSQPKGFVHPKALQVLSQNGYGVSGLSSKSWDVFASPSAPVIDFIITVCGNAAGETCPIWPGHPVTAHWGVDDPAAVQGSANRQMAAFMQAFLILRYRVGAFLKLEPSEVTPEKLDYIGQLLPPLHQAALS